MGFFDALGTVLDRVGGAAQGFFMSGGNPIGAVTGAVAVEQAKKRTKQLERAEFMYQQDPGLAAGRQRGKAFVDVTPWHLMLVISVISVLNK